MKIELTTGQQEVYDSLLINQGQSISSLMEKIEDVGKMTNIQKSNFFEYITEVLMSLGSLGVIYQKEGVYFKLPLSDPITTDVVEGLTENQQRAYDLLTYKGEIASSIASEFSDTMGMGIDEKSALLDSVLCVLHELESMGLAQVFKGRWLKTSNQIHKQKHQMIKLIKGKIAKGVTLTEIGQTMSITGYVYNLKFSDGTTFQSKEYSKGKESDLIGEFLAPYYEELEAKAKEKASRSAFKHCNTVQVVKLMEHEYNRTEAQEIMLSLKGSIEHIKESEMDEMCFDLEEGVLITGNQAKFLISLLEESLKS